MHSLCLSQPKLWEVSLGSSRNQKEQATWELPESSSGGDAELVSGSHVAGTKAGGLDWTPAGEFMLPRSGADPSAGSTSPQQQPPQCFSPSWCMCLLWYCHRSGIHLQMICGLPRVCHCFGIISRKMPQTFPHHNYYCDCCLFPGKQQRFLTQQSLTNHQQILKFYFNKLFPTGMTCTFGWWGLGTVSKCKRYTCTSTSARLSITRVQTAEGNWELDVSSASHHHRPPLPHGFNCFKKYIYKKGRKELKPVMNNLISLPTTCETQLPSCRKSNARIENRAFSEATHIRIRRASFQSRRRKMH